ncbi:MAG TPA: alpha-glucan family phosphorylase [Burkholderiaceae bacterium]|nr:alpha-glucan family phosphorylase [Burkholderiaceae bacterium]
MERPGTAYALEINPRIPRRLARLDEIAHDLWYSWDRSTRQLFARLDTHLWNAVGHSPKVLLKRIDERRLTEASEDPGFLNSFQRMLSAYDSYLSETARNDGSSVLGENDLIAYFCAEFGFHESLPIYSGGLGILAGDHCKAASDLRLPFIGIGLLYRQGYFQQKIDASGNQEAIYQDSEFDDLPVTPVLDANGAEVCIDIPLSDRTLKVKLWNVRVGHVRLLLLDTDLPANAESDRHVTHRLYGGDREVRILQEIVLGMGGVRALATLGMRPTVWHMNEGHAAFLVLERIHQHMHGGLDFAAALEAVAANTVFTTHTAVAAGHDRFSADLFNRYFDSYCRKHGIEPQRLFALGRAGSGTEFDMTALAVRGSRFQNGVSKIHGEVSAEMLRDLWPQIPPAENPLTHVTNAVHVPTFLSPDWVNDFDRFLGFDWLDRINDPAVSGRVDELPDHIVWSRHQFLKSQMLRLVRHRVAEQHNRNRGSEAHLDRMLRFADPDNPNVLTIGFGRRFATYKRATLLFENLEWLRQIVSDAKRPALFIFAGKAHPADQPGQDLIRRLAQVARMPELEGRILLVEGYDLRLARRLVSGVDVWLNNPVYPLEASGTSGMKAGINGVLNLSVLDGWWDEGYTGDNGWAIKPASETLSDAARNAEESRTLYEILQDQVLPTYYSRGEMGYPPAWIKLMKRSMATILPSFNANRMVGDYLSQFYGPAARQGRRFSRDEFRGAKEVAGWKARVVAAWPGTRIRRFDPGTQRTQFGQRLRIEVAVNLNGLEPSDVRVELRMGESAGDMRKDSGRFFVHANTLPETGEHRYVLDFTPESCGRFDYRIRVFPYHDLLTHRLETGLMLWL